MTFNEWWESYKNQYFVDEDWGMTPKEFAEMVWETCKEENRIEIEALKNQLRTFKSII